MLHCMRSIMNFSSFLAKLGTASISKHNGNARSAQEVWNNTSPSAPKVSKCPMKLTTQMVLFGFKTNHSLLFLMEHLKDLRNV